MLATGRPTPVVGPSRAEEEFEKRLDGLLLKGVGMIAIDNVVRPLEGVKLFQCLSQTLIEVRKLGGSDPTTIQSDAFFTATGNNLEITGDLRRRTLLCSLDAGMERPELKEFRRDPLKIAKAERGKYVVAP
jgi:putative DNA primase/helicase